MTNLLIVGSVLALLLLLVGFEVAHKHHLRTRTAATETLPREHVALRQRAKHHVWRDRSTWETVVRCELSPGWAWFRITGLPPRRGIRPAANHLEQMGWARTRRGARRLLTEAGSARR